MKLFGQVRVKATGETGTIIDDEIRDDDGHIVYIVESDKMKTLEDGGVEWPLLYLRANELVEL